MIGKVPVSGKAKGGHMSEREVLSPASTHSAASTSELVVEIFRSITDVLVICGLSHQQISNALRSALREAREVPGSKESIQLGAQQRDCMELMCTWRRDPAFLTERGLPRALRPTGSHPSFETLCRSARVTTRPGSLLETLTTFGAVLVSEDGTVCANTPTFLLGGSCDTDVLAVDGILKQIAGFVGSVSFNTKQAHAGKRPMFERACTVTVAAELIPVFERVVRERGQLFIDVLDEWLERHRIDESPSGRYAEIGAGAYFLNYGIFKNK